MTWTWRWPEWDDKLESASIESGWLALSTSGTLKPKRLPVSSFIVSDFEAEAGYAFATRLPLCELVVRRPREDDGGTTFTYEVSFVGPLSFLFGSFLGGRFPAPLPGSWRTSAV